MKYFLEKIVDRVDLERHEMMAIMNDLMEGQFSPAQIAAFITALRMKGETVEEITAAAMVMRSKALKVDLGDIDCFDCCGTGGDGQNTFNASTATAFIAAAAGVSVAKHGNRSVSGRCGSADVLEELGLQIDLSPGQAKDSILKAGFGFLFAPLFHQAMKHATLARKEIGIRTIFNILGPLANPAGAKMQLVGVYKQSLTNQLAVVLKNLGVKRAMVVHGFDGLDEISVSSPTYVTELKEDTKIIDYIIDPRDYGIPLADLGSITGGSPAVNARIIVGLFSGEVGPMRDVLLLNSGAALYVAGKAESIEEGIKAAAQLIDSGAVMNKLEELRRLTKECAV